MSLDETNVWGDTVITVCLFLRENWRCISDSDNSYMLANMSLMGENVCRFLAAL